MSALPSATAANTDRGVRRVYFLMSASKSRTTVIGSVSTGR
jgi:hypothetical protein